METLTHESLMPYGKTFKNLTMEEVPAAYLMKLYKQWHRKTSTNEALNQVMDYVEDWLDVIENRMELEEDEGWQPPQGLEEQFKKKKKVAKSGYNGVSYENEYYYSY